MKNRKALSSIVVGIFVCSFILGIANVGADQEVTFPDKNLEEVIREAIGKSSGPIYACDLEEITELDGREKGIKSIKGLEYCKNLTHLYLQKNNISDISPLSNLTNLESLSLWENNISDISPLSNLTNLTGLLLWENNISDISPLSNLTNLKWLMLDKNNISDISPLSTLTNLGGLSLSGNNILDISSLSNLTNLKILYLDHNYISDISPLIKNQGINEGDKVDISYNPLSSESIEIHIPELESRGVEVIWKLVEESLSTTTFLTYENSTYGIRIKYPRDWEKTEGGEPVAGLTPVVRFMTPQTLTNVSPEGFLIAVRDLSEQPMTLDEYFDYNFELLRTYLPGAKILDLGTTTLAGNPARKVVYTYTMETEQEKFNLKSMQICMIKDDKAYLILYLADKGDYEDFLGTVQEMIDSFEIVSLSPSTTLPPTTTPAHTTSPPTTTPAPTTSAPTTTPPPQKSNTSLYLGIVVAIVICALVIYQVTKKKPEKEPKKEKPIEKPLPKTKHCPFCGKEIPMNSKICPYCKKDLEVTPELKRLLEEKEEWKEKLDHLKQNKSELIEKGAMTKEEYQKRYDEIIDKLVDIEDKLLRITMGMKK